MMASLGNHDNHCFEHDFSLLLFGATLMLNLKFLGYAYRELCPAGKNDTPRPCEGLKKPEGPKG